MKTILKALTVAAFSGCLILPLLADDITANVDANADAKEQKDLKKVVEEQSVNYVETAQKGITLSGYVDVSYTNQFAGRGQEFNTSDANGNNQHTLRQFDTNANGFNVQAVKIALEKALPDKNEWAAGFRIDTILGQDATVLQDTAFSSSDVALEQALVKFRIPVGNGLDIYAGKFVTFLGYEVIESPANLNFSRGLLFTNAIPLTNTGVYADYKWNDIVETKFGIVDGWNNSTSTTSVDPQASYGFGGKAITGQVNVTNPGKNANICMSFIYAPDSTDNSVSNFGIQGPNGGSDNGPTAVYDVWGNWNPLFVKDSALTLGFNIDLGWSGAAGMPYTPPVTPSAATPQAWAEDSNTWWGSALYISYKFTKVFTLSGRLEYLHSDSTGEELPKYGFGSLSADEGTLGLIPATQDDYSATLTAAFNIWDNLLTRVEYRCDVLQGTTVAPPGFGGTGAGVVQAQHQTIEDEISVEAVYSF